ncbi:hypothetical protein AC630_09170 [Bradyrhizobium sp. AS23.2]|nr:hypothetical protein AC630_09170 [Bradyrhizobium sp. AS23.2]
MLIEINETHSPPLLQRADEVSFDQFSFHHQPAGNAAGAINQRHELAASHGYPRPPVITQPRKGRVSPRGDSIKIKTPAVSG